MVDSKIPSYFFIGFSEIAESLGLNKTPSQTFERYDLCENQNIFYAYFVSVWLNLILKLNFQNIGESSRSS